MRLIDADALFEVIKQHDYPLATRHNSIDNGMFTLGIKQAIDESPTIDAVPVVHGRWEYVDTRLLQTYYSCSECRNVTCDYIINQQTLKNDRLYYCPNCGAKMDEVSE